MSFAESPSVHIVDDDEAILRNLAYSLGLSGFQTKLYPAAQLLLDALPTLSGAVVTDVRMSGMDGAQLVRSLRAGGFGGPIIIVTGFADVELAVELMKTGADDLLQKPFPTARLAAAITTALQKRRSASASAADATAALEALRGLTARQHDVFNGIVEGKSNKQMARELGLSVRTVESYRGELMGKLQARSLSDLVRIAVRGGLIS